MGLKKPRSNQKGLKKLPKGVRNKMGYAKKGRRKKQIGGPMDPTMQDPNMMPQDPMMDQQAPMTPGDDFIEPERQIKFGAPRDKAFLGLGRVAGAVRGFRKNKGKGLGARLKGAAAGAVGGGAIGRIAGAVKGARGAKGQGFKERFKAAAKGALQGSGDAIESRLNGRKKKSSAQAGATGGKTRTTRMRRKPPRGARKPGAAGSPEVEPREQQLFGGGGREARQARRADRKAARQDKRAARQEMRQDRRAARQEIRQLPREERRAARQEMRQDFKERRQGIRQDFQAAKQQAGQPMADPMANNAGAPAAAPAAVAKQQPDLGVPKGPGAMSGMGAGTFDKNLSSGSVAFKRGGKKPRKKALFGSIANAIRKGRAAKEEGKTFGSGLGKEIAKGAVTGGVGMAVDGIKELRSPKEARQARKEARQERRAARKEMTGAERRADRKAARQERRAARKERRAKRKEFRKEMREDRRDVRANAGGDAPSKPKPSSSASDRPMAPPMTAMVKDGARKSMVDRRVKKKSGGYAIEKTASGKKMADTLGVKKNRKKAVGGIRKSNRLNAKKKKIEGQMKDSIGAVNAEGAKRQAEGKRGPGKLKKQLERRRDRVEKIENRITKHRRKNRTA